MLHADHMSGHSTTATASSHTEGGEQQGLSRSGGQGAGQVANGLGSTESEPGQASGAGTFTGSRRSERLQASSGGTQAGGRGTGGGQPSRGGATAGGREPGEGHAGTAAGGRVSGGGQASGADTYAGGIPLGGYTAYKTNSNRFLDDHAPDVSVILRGMGIDTFNVVMLVELQVGSAVLGNRQCMRLHCPQGPVP
jgi:hypothetical protein